MEEIKHSNQIFLFPYMYHLTDIFPNFSCRQMETNYAHVRNGRMRKVGWRPGCDGAWLAGASCMLWKPRAPNSLTLYIYIARGSPGLMVSSG
jgi:hypothetical protein